MTIDEAIKYLTDLSGEGPIPHPQDNIDALKLGIEALKRRVIVRDNAPPDAYRPLPGETPQIDNKRSLHHIKETLENKEVRK